MRKRLVWSAAVLAVLGLLALTARARPTLLVEAVAGVSCVGETLCIDDPARLAEATRLYGDALAFVDASITPLQRQPLVVFCSTPACYASFSHDGSAAQSVGGFAIVVSPRGWQPFFVRHEMIHRLQAQQLGVLRMFTEPQWFVEGMAYSMSQDPRHPLAEPFESWRVQFDAWHRGEAGGDLWAAARRL